MKFFIKKIATFFILLIYMQYALCAQAADRSGSVTPTERSGSVTPSPGDDIYYVLTQLNEDQVTEVLQDIALMDQSYKEKIIKNGFSDQQAEYAKRGINTYDTFLRLVTIRKDRNTYSLVAFRLLGGYRIDYREIQGRLGTRRLSYIGDTELKPGTVGPEFIAELNNQDTQRERKRRDDQATFDAKVAESLFKQYGPKKGFFYRSSDSKLFINRGIPLTVSEDKKRDNMLSLYRTFYNILLGKHFVEEGKECFNYGNSVANVFPVSLQLPLLVIDENGPTKLLEILNQCFTGSGETIPVKVGSHWFMNKYLGTIAQSVVNQHQLDALNQLLASSAEDRKKAFESGPDSVWQKVQKQFEEKQIDLLREHFSTGSRGLFTIEEVNALKAAMQGVEANRNTLWNMYIQVKERLVQEGKDTWQASSHMSSSNPNVTTSSVGSFITRKKVIGAACLAVVAGAGFGLYKAHEHGLIDANDLAVRAWDATRSGMGSAASSAASIARKASSSLAEKASEFWAERGAPLMNSMMGNVTSGLGKLKFW